MGGDRKHGRNRVAALVCAFALLCPAAIAQSNSRAKPQRPADDSGDDWPAPTVSNFVALDSWSYAAVERLAALGYVDSAFLGIRPWTRAEFARLTSEADENASDREEKSPTAEALIRALRAEFASELRIATAHKVEIDSVYARAASVSAMPLTDSYHFGETLTNDYGRPFGRGFNAITGASASALLGRFSFKFTGEYQHAPAIASLSDTARRAISDADGVPLQPVPSSESRNVVRIIDANVSTTVAGLQVTVGKQSFWWGPGESGAMVLSNNADPIYALRLTNIDPIQLPSLLAYLGPMRFDSFFGHLQGHRYPVSPYFYGQKISLKPTPNLEFGFSRTVVFAGQGVTPLTWSTFVHSFFSTSSGTAPGFDLRQNPGARHAGFDFSYRLPGLRRWGVTLYTDSVAHDDVSPASAPRRAAINPGLYIARLPMLRAWEFRAEAVNTDPPTSRSNGGKFLYWEGIYRDAYVNGGNLMGNWVGREGKGGQAWLAYVPDPHSRFEMSYRRAKLAKDFIAGGGTQDNLRFSADWLLRPSLQARAAVQVEHWTVPALAATPQTDVVTSFEIHWLKPGKLRKE